MPAAAGAVIVRFPVNVRSTRKLVVPVDPLALMLPVTTRLPAKEYPLPEMITELNPVPAGKLLVLLS